MSTSNFVHLHTHSSYSLLDGMPGVKELVAAAVKMGSPAIALTDHGVVHGLVELYRETTLAGIKGIMGCELYLAPRSRFDRSGAIDREPGHLVLLAMNTTGYHNLIQLSSRGHTEGFYYKPRIDLDLLQQYQEGLIALSACPSGEIPQLILADNLKGARELAATYASLFSQERFYLELMDHGLPEESRVNRELVRIARELNIPLVASNDAHYIASQDAPIHDILLCVQTGARVNDNGRLRFPSNNFHLRTSAEMAHLFAELPEALSNTWAITERCNFKFKMGEFQLPQYPLPPGKDGVTLLQELVTAGVQFRYGEASPAINERAAYEIAVINAMGFVGYFLIVWDFVNFAKENGIPVGPGRGSVTGSLVAYTLGITNVDPLAYGLIFERFLNPERVSMPDIDIDFCFERRGEVIAYVTRKYGEEHVAQIATFGTLGIRSAVRDVGKALEMPLYEVDRLAKLIPFEYEQSVDRALQQTPALQEEIKEKAAVRHLFELVRRVEGKPRNISMHAAGVVITPQKLTELLPLLRPRDGGLLTQYAMDDLETLGFLKIDFLGLRTLTVIRRTLALIAELYGVQLKEEDIPLDDAATYAMLSRGESDGVFQLESPGMRRVLKMLKPNCIEDIIATNALYRPGPMEHIPEFVAAKNGQSTINYLHPKLEPILAPTYGVVVYQEQVMQVAHALAGFSLGEADLLRRAMAKRDAQALIEQQERFLAGAAALGVSSEVAQQVFAIIRPFGSYGFNKSHSAAYGILAYHTAWLITHYPLPYFAALLSSFFGHQEQTARYLRLLQSRGIPFYPPHINNSWQHFVVEGAGLRFGLLAIKNLGFATVEAILRERQEGGEYRSLGDFVRRLAGEVNKRHLEALINSGAFDSLGARAEHLLILPQLQDQLFAAAALISKGQTSLFEGGGKDLPLPEEAIKPQGLVGSFTLKELQNMELEATGFVFTHQVAATGAAQQPKVTELPAAPNLYLTIQQRSKLRLEDLKAILKRYPGNCPVYLELQPLG
ncbi:MAG: DNA polymerase III subunit alpha, partial [Symbiobacteriaceae bacterium]|nr:DNA polymerase III subunit alpha [Symbiobacteriaceae bacterium]